MGRVAFYLLLFALAISLGGATNAQEEHSADDLHEAFLQAVDDYKQTVREIKALQVDYQTGEKEKQEQVNLKLKEVVSIGRARMQVMVDAALAAFEADPDKNPQVAALLKEVAIHNAIGARPQNATGGNFVGGDQPERALRVVETLVEGGETGATLYVIGALSAVYTNDFDMARKYYDLAMKENAFDGLPRFPDSETDPITSYRISARERYQMLDELEADWKAEAKIRAAEAEADDLPRVKLETTKGEIVLELFENEAPGTVANFITLVKQGYYDGLSFHRVLPDFMAQGGDNGRGPGYTIPCECYHPDHRKHFRGSLSMAKTAARDSGSAQFFLCFVPTKHLDGQHTVFGRVIDGIGLLGELQKIDPSQPGPYPEADKILKATVLRDRGHEYKFEKLPGPG